MRFLFVLVFCFILITNTKANEIFNKNFQVSLSYLQDKPKSYAKDFFIIQFIKQKNTKKKEALIALKMAHKNNVRVKKAFNKKFSSLSDEEYRCYVLKTTQLLKETEKCLALGLSLFETTKLSTKEIQKAIKKLKNYSTLRNDLKVFNSSLPFLNLISSNKYRFYRIFFESGKKFRQKELNHPLNKKFLENISKNKRFNKFVKYIVNDDKLNFLQKSLLFTKDNKNLNHSTLFSLFINALKLKKEKKALYFLTKAYKKAYFKMDQDKVLFWFYLIKKDKKYLKTLAKSWDNNIYSLYAKEKENIKLKNIFYDINIKKKKSTFDENNQFEWIKILRDIKKDLNEKKLNKYKNILTQNNHKAHLAFILERFYNYKNEYFLSPYKNYLKNYPVKDRILIYSLARQESRFIPSSISTATAQGLMQIMPFVSKEIAKEKKEEFNIYKMFSPKKNISYSYHHLKKLKRGFKNNILFIAYAYNGGAGYLKKQLKRGLFKKGKYEPFLSMERISYNETKRYGKKVLANYVIYNNHLNKRKIKISSIFENLQ